MESFVIYPSKRYNIKGKQYLKSLDKYYAVDIGLRRMLLGAGSFDVGHILDNVLYDADTMEELESAKGIVLVEKAMSTMNNEILRELELISRQAPKCEHLKTWRFYL